MQRVDRDLPLPAVLRLKDDVEEALVDGMLLLHSRSDLRGVRVSRSAQHVLPLLRDGVTFEQICETFGRRTPSPQRDGLAAFLTVLQRAGLLQSPDQARGGALVRYAGWDVSAPAARLGAIVRGSRVATAVAFIALLAAVCAIVWAASIVAPQCVAIGRLAAAQPLALAFGIGTVFVIVIPLHELAHAVIAGACGVPTARLVIARRGAWPAIFCETPGSSLVAGRLRRLAIPAAGPAVDAAFASIFGLLALGAHGAAVPYLAAAACAAGMAFVLDFNPYTSSDGSRLIEILLDDDFARRTAFSRRNGLRSMPGTARVYLGIAIVYLVTVVCAIGALGASVYGTLVK